MISCLVAGVSRRRYLSSQRYTVRSLLRLQCVVLSGRISCRSEQTAAVVKLVSFHDMSQGSRIKIVDFDEVNLKSSETAVRARYYNDLTILFLYCRAERSFQCPKSCDGDTS